MVLRGSTLELSVNSSPTLRQTSSRGALCLRAILTGTSGSGLHAECCSSWLMLVLRGVLFHCSANRDVDAPLWQLNFDSRLTTGAKTHISEPEMLLNLESRVTSVKSDFANDPPSLISNAKSGHFLHTICCGLWSLPGNESLLGFEEMTGRAAVLVVGMVSSTSPSLWTCGALPPSHLSDFLPTPATVHKKFRFS